jgi:hypothetical protein
LKKLKFPFVFIAATVIFFLFSTPDGISSAAELRYVRIADDGIILYTIDSGYEFQPLFALPKTYYVEYSGRSNSKYYIVRYMDLKSGLGGADLFVLKSAVNVADAAAVDSPYPSVTIRNALGGANLYAAPNSSSAVSASIPSSNSALTYYGTVLDEDGGIWHYAAYNGVCGYIGESVLVEPPTVNPHPNSAPPAQIPSKNPDASGGDPATTLILIAGIILPAAIIFLLMFRPIKRRAALRRNGPEDSDRGGHPIRDYSTSDDPRRYSNNDYSTRSDDKSYGIKNSRRYSNNDYSTHSDDESYGIKNSRRRSNDAYSSNSDDNQPRRNYSTDDDPRRSSYSDYSTRSDDNESYDIKNSRRRSDYSTSDDESYGIKNSRRYSNNDYSTRSNDNESYDIKNSRRASNNDYSTRSDNDNNSRRSFYDDEQNQSRDRYDRENNRSDSYGKIPRDKY